MPENFSKISQSVSPVARAGAGDISERELSRERCKLQTTPPARLQRSHPKKQLFSTPVNKFTATTGAPNTNLNKIRSCLKEYQRQATPLRRIKTAAKAASMEDLTPTKRVKREKKDKEVPVLRSQRLHGIAEEQAAAKIGRFILVTTWRRRREEVRCLRKTLEFQVSCSERLRIQVSTLKSLLDSDNDKVRLAIREVDRLKQLLRDKEAERAVLEREKVALENDVSAAENRISDMSIGWRNCRNELEGARGALLVRERALATERVAATAARADADHAYARLSVMEQELLKREALLTGSVAEVTALRREAAQTKERLESTASQLKLEREGRERCTRECSLLSLRLTVTAEESAALKGLVDELRAQVARLDTELTLTKEQLEWWPRPLTRMLGAARSWLLHPLSFPEAVMWTLIPSRHGC